VSGSEQRRGKRFSDALGRICSLARKEDRLDVCDVDKIGGKGLKNAFLIITFLSTASSPTSSTPLSSSLGTLWRLAAFFDDNVEEWHSRDLDSR